MDVAAKLAEAERQLSQALNRIKEADERADKEKARADQEQLRADHEKARADRSAAECTLLRTTSLSTSHVFGTFASEATTVDNVLSFGLDEVDPVAVKQCWCKVRDMRIDGDGTDEKKHAHPFVEDVLKLVCETFAPNLLVRHEVTFTLPNYILDFTLSAATIKKPTYLTLLASIEVKAPMQKSNKRDAHGAPIVCRSADSLSNQGQGQAISYLSATIAALNANDSSGDPVQRYAVFTDGLFISFFAYVGNDPTIKIMTDLLPLADPFKEIQDENPPFGLAFLCALVQKISKHAAPLYLMVRQKRYLVSSIALNTPFSFVAIVQDCDEKEENLNLVLKQIKITIPHLHPLERELRAYQLLKEQRADLNLLHYHKDRSDNTHMFLSPVGKTLAEVLLEFREIRTDPKKTLGTILSKTITEFEKMHQAGFCHVDVRPQNIIVVGDLENCLIYLIDFQTMIKSKTFAMVDTRSVFSSSAYLLAQNPECYVYGPEDDLESFAYSILMMAINPFPMTSFAQLPVTRRAEIEKLKPDNYLGNIAKRMHDLFIDDQSHPNLHEDLRQVVLN